jgi:hypothetical protein
LYGITTYTAFGDFVSGISARFVSTGVVRIEVVTASAFPDSAAGRVFSTVRQRYRSSGDANVSKAIASQLSASA